MMRITYNGTAFVVELPMEQRRRYYHFLRRRLLARQIRRDAYVIPAHPRVLSELESRMGNELWLDPVSISRYRDEERRGRELREAARSRQVVDGWRTRDFPREKPYDHQWGGVAWLIESGRGAILNDRMGLGKTMQAINAACRLISDGQERRVLVVCPKSVLANWAREIGRHAWADRPLHPIRTSLIPDGRTQARKEVTSFWASTAWKQSRWLILNYEALRYFPNEFHAACKGSILICDEAHRLKDARTQQSKIVRAAEQNRIWLLTGTPVANRLEDIWHLIHLVRPGLLYWTFGEFGRNHLVRESQYNRVVGYRHLEWIKKRWELVAVGREKEDCLDLPEKIYIQREVELTQHEYRAYKMMENELRAWLEAAEIENGQHAEARASHFATRMLRLRQIADGYISETGGDIFSWAKGLSKIEAAIETWEDSGRPRAVIWSAYVAVTQKCAERFRAKGVPAWAVTGETTRRQEIVDEWSEAESAVLCCQMNAMGEGWNGQASDFQVFIDVPHTPKERLQCIDRLHRIGQNRHVRVIDILALGTIDHPLHDRLAHKIEVAQGLTDASRFTLTEIKKILEGGS